MHFGFKALSFRKPSARLMSECCLPVRDGDRLHFNHNSAALTEGGPEACEQLRPDGYIVSSASAQVGKGHAAYESVRRAMHAWQHTELGWVTSNCPPIQQSSRVCLAARCICLWIRNPLSIVYVNDGPVPSTRRGRGILPWRRRQQSSGQQFMYGSCTLRGHLLAGEERFAVRWNKHDDSVWYQVFSFSKPDSVLARVLFPIVAFHQRKFRRDSVLAMTRLVQRNREHHEISLLDTDPALQT
ncbi:hypothetical protein WJX73_009325 [Symbiochloris irregularis]|uniref:DUF1990 domain-containing protein n=1 Tax=Symbiochloris irregularis TaxID=706552 RepID=A0AAW1NX52_9CHLO